LNTNLPRGHQWSSCSEDVEQASHLDISPLDKYNQILVFSILAIAFSHSLSPSSFFILPPSSFFLPSSFFSSFFLSFFQQLDNVHPKNWEVVEPAKNYNLVIIGAGTGGYPS